MRPYKFNLTIPRDGIRRGEAIEPFLASVPPSNSFKPAGERRGASTAAHGVR
jgi:hypothetical protein